MTIAEMHVWFRQYAQQMGMQNVRAILPEQIDLLINTSITDTVNQIITQNIGVANDRIITDNSKLGQINALSSLYKVKIVDASTRPVGYTGHPFVEGDETYIKRIYATIKDFGGTQYYIISRRPTSGGFRYDALPIDKETYEACTNKIELSSISELSNYENSDYFNYGLAYNDRPFDYLYLVDLALNYTNTTTKTNYFPVRLIDDVYLADTLNDFVLRPRLRTPIAVIYNNQLDLYIDTMDDGRNLPQGLFPNELRVSYIAKPAKVQYLSDVGGKNVNCDLPEYLHVDILKHAVDLYRISIQGGMYAAQQQQQAQNNEINRNNARPTNEGYQS